MVVPTMELDQRAVQNGLRFSIAMAGIIGALIVALRRDDPTTRLCLAGIALYLVDHAVRAAYWTLAETMPPLDPVSGYNAGLRAHESWLSLSSIVSAIGAVTAMLAVASGCLRCQVGYAVWVMSAVAGFGWWYGIH